ncbi:retinoic acid receptor responder protein 1 [Spea bombifrons]|uniref:retinoic acid receptor responder protein 1 n=1 Tax=Spea bombifrons TaxID=233779 RepID=UPI0023491BC9|nr:retinoic acid receptor responder protein 1 [Spea bombifrons]
MLLCLLILLPLAAQALPFAIVSPGLGKTREIPTNYRTARHPAVVAVQYINYYTGSPNNLQSLLRVNKATVKSVPEIGNKYYVEFTTKVYKDNQDIRACSASVFFHQEKPRPAINVNCSESASLKSHRQDDYNFYKQMKQRTTPLIAKDIPDSFGYVAPDIMSLFDLAELGSSYVMWEKSTEQREYFLQKIQNVKQLIRKDDLIAFDYDILLYETPSERMVSCSLHIVWIPGKPPKVEYHCSNGSEEDGSGSEESGFLGNFK